MSAPAALLERCADESLVLSCFVYCGRFDGILLVNDAVVVGNRTVLAPCENHAGEVVLRSERVHDLARTRCRTNTAETCLRVKEGIDGW